MKLILPLLSMAIVTALSLNPAESAMRKDVSFASNGQTLAGHLYLPNNFVDGQKLPGVVVTGAWTTVKEQMPATYASALADKGYAVLTFDFRGWGQSPDKISYLEDPKRKTEDIVAAIQFLSTRVEVDPKRLSGLGICASAGYMSDAALRSDKVRSLALVAPWLHDTEIVEKVYGGKEGVQRLIAVSRNAKTSDEAVILEAASTTNKNAVMYQAPYYTEKTRGAIPQYDNKFNAASWELWLRYNAIQSAEKLKTPTILVHSEAAAIPQGAKRYAKAMGKNAKVVWLDNVTQFDFYDDENAVQAAVDKAHAHFMTNAARKDVKKDEASIRSTIQGVAVLADLGHFDALQRLYADEVEVDYTSLTGGDVEVVSPSTLMMRWASLLPGFETTKHSLGEIVVEVTGHTARASSTVTAKHFVEGRQWTVSGDYKYELTRDGNRWKITRHILTVKDESGTRDVIDLAMKRARKNPNPYVVRHQTQQTVIRFLQALERKDMNAFADVWAEDAIQEMPYAPKGFPKRVSGKEKLVKHYAQWPKNSGAADFTTGIRFYPMSDPQHVFVEYKGVVEIVSTGRQYLQSYGGLFQVEGGKISLFREYFNPVPFVHAFGLDEGGNFNTK